MWHRLFAAADRAGFWPRSLIARILILELGAILIAAILLPTIMISLLHEEMNRYQSSIMTEQARGIAGGIKTASGHIVVQLTPELANAYATPYDGRAYVIADQVPRALASSAFADLVPWRDAPRLNDPGIFRSGNFIGVSLPVAAGGRRLWVVVTQDEAGPGAIVDDIARAFLWRYSPILLLILLLLPLVNSLLVRRVVLAVQSVSKRAKTIGPGNLDVRLEESSLPNEVAPLAHATNALLVRLQQSFRQQSEFVANVAHELRTPLATLKVELEAIDDAPLRRRLGQTVDRLTHVVSQLQDLGTLEVIAQDRMEQIDASGLAREVVEELAPEVFANTDVIELITPDHEVEVRGNRTLAALALANLISNATRHTPAGTTISVRVMPEGRIEVHDNGPGIASSDPEQSKQRYWRADHRRSDSAGIGLSIVTRIMEVHGGALLVDSKLGEGSRFTLVFSPLDGAGEGG